MTWDLSRGFDTASQPDDELPAGAAQPAFEWQTVTAERTGLVNIARYRTRRRGAASSGTGRDLVYARSTMTGTRTQRMKLDFAYSDAVHIFVNGRLVFAGDSAFSSRYPLFLGIASLGHDAVFIDLQPGRNEIVLAVEEKFGGWGFAARLDPLVQRKSLAAEEEHHCSSPSAYHRRMRTTAVC